MKGFHSRSSSIYLLICFLMALCYQDLLLLSIMLLIMVVFNYRLDRAAGLGKVMRFTLPVILLIILLNALINQNGENILVTIQALPVVGNVYIYREAIYFAIAMSVKLLLILSIFTVFNILIPLERLFDVFGSYTGKTVLIAGISARMVPELAGRAKSIREVQAYRGHIAGGKNISQRVRTMGPLLTNLLRSSLDSSLQKAEAMQVRAYGSGRRSIYLEEYWHLKDSLLVFLSLMVFLLAIVNLFLKPDITGISLHLAYWKDAVLLSLLAVPVFLYGAKSA